jgi:hypothetical protein
MNKKTLIGLAAFVVVVIGGVITVWAFSDEAQESMTPSVATTTDTATLPPAPQPETRPQRSPLRVETSHEPQTGPAWEPERQDR